MSAADLPPYITAAIAVVGTLLGGLIAGLFGFSQMKRTQAALRQDTWVKAWDEQRRLIWSERKLAYAQLMTEADRLNRYITAFEPGGPAAFGLCGPMPTGWHELNEPYRNRLVELSEQFDRCQEAYWRVQVVGQRSVLDKVADLYQLQREATVDILQLQPYNADGLLEAFGELAVVMRRGLNRVPDAMRVGVKGVTFIQTLDPAQS